MRVLDSASLFFTRCSQNPPLDAREAQAGVFAGAVDRSLSSAELTHVLVLLVDEVFRDIYLMDAKRIQEVVHLRLRVRALFRLHVEGDSDA